MKAVRHSERSEESPAPHPSPLPVLAFASQQAWDKWLAAHRADKGVWLRLAKKNSKHASVTYPEALESALAHGWIDGQKDRHDAEWWLQKFTPRGPRSPWSKINRDKAEKLMQTGRMTDAGLREVERARADGRWDRAYDSHRTSAIPDDFARALSKEPQAASFFADLDSANRYSFLYRIQTAKKPETRERRIAEFLAKLRRRETFHPIRKKRR